MTTTAPHGVHVGSDRTLFDDITAAMPKLRRSEQKVAQAILDDPHACMHASMAELARLAGVSEPTVMRFCAAVHSDGFNALKLRLAQSLAFGLPAAYAVIQSRDGTPELVGKIFDFTIGSLARARRALDDDQVARAIDVLASAREALFLGFGASGIVAQDAQQKFPLFGIPCSAPVDAHQQFIAASLVGPETAVVAISNTGTTLALHESADVARANGATVIGISGSVSPLMEHCDVPIVVETLENTDVYTPTISRLAQLTVIDILATGVALRHEPRQAERLRVMKAQVKAMRAGQLPHDGADGRA